MKLKYYRQVRVEAHDWFWDAILGKFARGQHRWISIDLLARVKHKVKVIERWND